MDLVGNAKEDLSSGEEGIDRMLLRTDVYIHQFLRYFLRLSMDFLLRLRFLRPCMEKGRKLLK